MSSPSASRLISSDKLNKPDIVDYKIIVDAVGANWLDEGAKLPNLLNTEVKFDLDLRPGLDDDEPTEGTDDIDAKKLKKDKKVKKDKKSEEKSEEKVEEKVEKKAEEKEESKEDDLDPFEPEA